MRYKRPGYLEMAAGFAQRNAAAKAAAAPARARRRHDESDIQCALISRVRLEIKRYPELRALFAVPNGAYIAPVKNESTGEWYKPHAQRLRAEGLKAGVFDLMLAWPSGDGRYHGLFLETKAPGEKLSGAQQQWRELMSEALYDCRLYTDPEEGFRHLLDYLGYF